MKTKNNPTDPYRAEQHYRDIRTTKVLLMATAGFMLFSAIGAIIMKVLR